MGLTAEQEDYLLEEGQEEYYENKLKCISCESDKNLIELDFKGSNEYICEDCRGD